MVHSFFAPLRVCAEKRLIYFFFIYLPMIGARSLFVFAGASFAGVMIVFRRASPQEQLRAAGSILTASRIMALDVSMFFFITARTASTVTASSLWCQQS